MRNTFTIEADIKKSNNRKNIVVTQNDSIRFIIGVFDDGIPFSLSEVSTTSLASTLPDKQTIVTNGLKVGDNTIQFDLGTNETSVPGVVRAVIQLYDSNDRVSTISFTYTVVKDPTGDGYVPSETEQTLIQVVLNDGPLVIQDAQDQANYAKSQGDYAKQVADKNKTTWKTPVVDYASIATTYPSPQHGDTVQTLDNGKIYRYNSNTTTWEFTQEYNDTAITDLQNKLSQQNKQSVTLTHGTKVVNAEQNSPLDVSIEGRTLVNLLGKDGNFEDLTSFNGGGTRDTSTYVYGSKSLKMGYGWSAYEDLAELGVQDGDKILVICYTKTDAPTSKPRISINGNDFYGKSSNDWHVMYGKLTYDSTIPNSSRLYLLHNTNSSYFSWFDGVAVYKLTSEEYNNIGTTWDDEEVARRYPYVDSVQQVQNPYVIAEGENLLPPFTEWTLGNNVHVKSGYEIETDGTSSHIFINVIPNQTYHVSVDSNADRFLIREKDGTGIGNFISGGQFTPISDTIKIETYNYTTSNGLYFKNPMLTLGNQAKPFVPRNPSALYAELKLGALSDKKDILYRSNGDWYLRKNVEKDVKLDGSLGWVFGSNETGFKVVNVLNFFNGLSSYDQSLRVVKYNGKIILPLLPSGVWTNGDEAHNSLSSNQLKVSISDTDSGWGESYTPTANEIKAYFWGWRMCDGTYGVPYNGTGTKTWHPIADTDLNRAVTSVPTSEAPTITEGKIDYYKLSYALATPQTINVTDKVEGELAVNGATQVKAGSGFTYVETDGQRDYTLLGDDDRYNVTANLLSAPSTYNTSLKSVVDDVVAKQADISSTVSVHVRAIAELYKRVKALGG